LPDEKYIILRRTALADGEQFRFAQWEEIGTFFPEPYSYAAKALDQALELLGDDGAGEYMVIADDWALTRFTVASRVAYEVEEQEAEEESDGSLERNLPALDEEAEEVAS
jgi:hypothetical protein